MMDWLMLSYRIEIKGDGKSAAGSAPLMNSLGCTMMDSVTRGSQPYLGEKSVEAVDLLPLLHKCVVLRDTLECQLVHEVDLVRLVEPPLRKVLHSHGEGRRIEQNLAGGGRQPQDALDDGLEFRREQLVRLGKARGSNGYRAQPGRAGAAG